MRTKIKFPPGEFIGFFDWDMFLDSMFVMASASTTMFVTMLVKLTIQK